MRSLTVAAIAALFAAPALAFQPAPTDQTETTTPAGDTTETTADDKTEEKKDDNGAS